MTLLLRNVLELNNLARVQRGGPASADSSRLIPRTEDGASPLCYCTWCVCDGVCVCVMVCVWCVCVMVCVRVFPTLAPIQCGGPGPSRDAWTARWHRDTTKTKRLGMTSHPAPLDPPKAPPSSSAANARAITRTLRGAR